MQDTVDANVIIETKFFRPGLPVDMVRRPRLTAYLKKRQQSCPLTLVSAPAGYGKSTLMSCWLDSVDCPTAWLSLDEQDNDFVGFLRYFLAAIQTIFPTKLLETAALLTSLPLPSVAAIASTLINEINQIDTFFILVLDDYHLIQEQTIHDLLNELLLHPQQNLHLVIGTRIDPPFSLVTLRGKGWVTEVRVPSLRFNQEESLTLFKKMTGTGFDEKSLAEINAKAEGWVTGLRLAALAMSHRIGREIVELKLSLNNRYISEYLLSEILAKQAATLSDCMLKTSIPARFSAGLCEALCLPVANSLDDGSVGANFTGENFLEWLRNSNLFVIPLDDRNEWYRYHHIFREFLQQELVRRFGYDEIKQLHAIAGHWYARNGWIDEAFYHLLPSGEISKAIELVAQHRYSMMNDVQWPRLENWLKMFQDNIIETSPELWMLKTWLTYQYGRWAELPVLLEKLDTMLADETDQVMAGRLSGEIHSLRSLIAYHRGNAEAALSEARMALELVPPELWIVRVHARLYLGGSLQMLGDEKGSFKAFFDAFEVEQFQTRRFKAAMLMTVCHIYWLAADLHSIIQFANQSILLCLETGYRQILGHSRYQLGRAHYQQNDLPTAEECFASVVDTPYQNYGTVYANSACGLGMTYQAQGREGEARQVAEGAIAFLLKSGNTSQLPLILALQAELALKQGDLAAASQWAAKLDPVPPLLPMFQMMAPHLTLVKVWLAQNTPTSLEKAGELLVRLREYLTGVHNTRYLIETLALQALLAQDLGDQEAAQAALEQALRLAQAGGFIRVFVDAGPGMASLLTELEIDNGLRDYVWQVRAACSSFQQTKQALSSGDLIEPLTDRELKILELLRERLSNKEIAAQLVISPGTVKGHTIKIYQKLDVNSRRQAVEKAISLGILMPVLNIN